MPQAASENSRQGNYATHQPGTSNDVSPKQNPLAPLLVSVRSQREAHSVAHFPFEILDLKEPNNGPLGPCDPLVWYSCIETTPLPTAVMHVMPAHSAASRTSKADACGFFETSPMPSSSRDEPSQIGKSWSVALGEYHSAINLAAEVPPAVRYAKAGPAGLPDTRRLSSMWDRLRQQLPETTELVAVAYADAQFADCLEPEKIFSAAASFGLTTVLIDTFDKGRGSVFQLLGVARIRQLIQTASSLNCSVVLAGGITCTDAETALSMGYRRIGLRGALCRGPRDGEIDPQAVGRWCESLLRQPDTQLSS